ncbi:MAG: hypothetical protein FWG16_01655, partial [Micrococcales bacterium]|nr:hypothetical protein [Micrococcales bacterium]
MKVWKKVAAVAVLAIGLGACGSNDEKAPTDNKTDSDAGYVEGGTFTMAVAADPGSLNPLNNTSTASTWLFRMVYDPLVFRDFDGKPSPALASD